MRYIKAIKKVPEAIALGLAVLGFSACHTAAGVGQDIEEVGEEMQEASREVH